ncbi:FAD/NAD(P)-binding protein, partial [Corynebacterium bovis]
MTHDRSTAGAAAGAPTPGTALDGAPDAHPTAARPETGPETRPAPVTVAVVGAGPRGLWAAECLADEARAHRVPVAVDVVDDAPPGAGAAYGPGQPDHWTLNVDSRIVRTGVGTFADWARRHGPGAGAGGAGGAGQTTGDAGQTTADGNAARGAGQTTGDAVPFPPRSVVGDFLADSWRALAADPARAPWFTLRHVRRRVRDV